MFLQLFLRAKLIGFAAVFAAMTPAIAADVFHLSPMVNPLILSDQVHVTNKGKIIRAPDGALLAVYGLGRDGTELARDPQAHSTRTPYDLVIQSSTDHGDTWSAPINIDNTVAPSSALGITYGTGFPPLFPTGNLNVGATNLAAHSRAINYPGNADKPQLFNVGNNIVVTFSNTYCKMYGDG